MTAKKYRIKLTPEEQHELETLVSRRCYRDPCTAMPATCAVGVRVAEAGIDERQLAPLQSHRRAHRTETVATLKKTCKPWLKQCCLPPQASAGFVGAMETHVPEPSSPARLRLRTSASVRRRTGWK